MDEAGCALIQHRLHVREIIRPGHDDHRHLRKLCTELLQPGCAIHRRHIEVQ